MVVSCCATDKEFKRAMSWYWKQCGGMPVNDIQLQCTHEDIFKECHFFFKKCPCQFMALHSYKSSIFIEHIWLFIYHICRSSTHCIFPSFILFLSFPPFSLSSHSWFYNPFLVNTWIISFNQICMGWHHLLCQFHIIIPLFVLNIHHTWHMQHRRPQKNWQKMMRRHTWLNETMQVITMKGQLGSNGRGKIVIWRKRRCKDYCKLVCTNIYTHSHHTCNI